MPVKVRWANGDAITASAIACGLHHTCFIDVFDDKVKCFGNNGNGQLGDGSTGINKSDLKFRIDSISGVGSSIFSTSLITFSEVQL